MAFRPVRSRGSGPGSRGSGHRGIPRALSVRPVVAERRSALARAARRGCRVDADPAGPTIPRARKESLPRGGRPPPRRETSMAQAGRPLSPHCRIYRWYFTMALSIAHRVTGVGADRRPAAAGLVADGVSRRARELRHRPGGDGQHPGRPGPVRLHPVLLLPHLNGIRHLVWDAGYNLETTAARQSGVLVHRRDGGPDAGHLGRPPDRRLKEDRRRHGRQPQDPRPRPGAGLDPPGRPTTGSSSGSPRWRWSRSPCGSSSRRSRSPGAGYEEVRLWLAGPFNTTCHAAAGRHPVLAHPARA